MIIQQILLEQALATGDVSFDVGSEKDYESAAKEFDKKAKIVKQPAPVKPPKTQDLELETPEQLYDFGEEWEQAVVDVQDPKELRRYSEQLPKHEFAKITPPEGMRVRGGDMGYGTQEVQDILDKQPAGVRATPDRPGLFIGDAISKTGMPPPHQNQTHGAGPSWGSAGYVDVAIPLSQDKVPSSWKQDKHWSTREGGKFQTVRPAWIDEKRAGDMIRSAAPDAKRIIINPPMRKRLMKHFKGLVKTGEMSDDEYNNINKVMKRKDPAHKDHIHIAAKRKPVKLDVHPGRSRWTKFDESVLRSTIREILIGKNIT